MISSLEAVDLHSLLTWIDTLCINENDPREIPHQVDLRETFILVLREYLSA